MAKTVFTDVPYQRWQSRGWGPASAILVISDEYLSLMKKIDRTGARIVEGEHRIIRPNPKHDKPYDVVDITVET